MHARTPFGRFLQVSWRRWPHRRWLKQTVHSCWDRIGLFGDQKRPSLLENGLFQPPTISSNSVEM